MRTALKLKMECVVAEHIEGEDGVCITTSLKMENVCIIE